ncbi:aminotransferase class I/II-fold pyridoxal phosphate-dependent enzyme [Streptomyces sp. 6N223]|uniref:aminotransferase class I/II-fold pyridoxal phosphate-dependent enzyme n=1 Tax=Streptomyces sp. 6N223 TaxID=3457412 RepID=UPI003FD2A6A8
MSDLGSATASAVALARAREAGGYPYFRRLTGHPAPGEVLVEGIRAINAASTDYLGLARDPRVSQAAARAAHELGASCSGSPLVIGTLALHSDLEEELADFLHRPAVLLSATGFQANLTMACLFIEGATVLSDWHNHASLVDAVRLGHTVNRRFRHNDPLHLERLLEEAAGQPLPPVILTEGAFSLGYDLVKLPQIADLADRYDATLIVDGAHDIGVLGAGGRGVGEYFGREPDITVLTGTFSKAFGSVGGFVAGPADLIDHCRIFGRAAVYSASIPPSATAAALAALRIIRCEPERRTVVGELAAHLHRGLAEQGRVAPAWTGPVVQLPVGSPDECLRVWRELLEAGVFTAAFLPPAVPPGQSSIRLSVTAAHTAAHIDRILEVLDSLLPPAASQLPEQVPCPVT